MIRKLYPPREFPVREPEAVTHAKERRSWAQREIITKRDDLRRQVGLKRLRQQGLSQHEAEEQYGSRLWKV